MLFNSIEFAIFLPVVFFLYWLLANRNLHFQNILLLLASYFFYGWWDWRFLLLLIAISIFNYLVGIRIGVNEIEKRRKIWLIIGLIINIGILSVFKYFNFFIDSFIDFISIIGYNIPKSSTRIILPLGISFYLFLSMSYLIDISKNSLAANKNIIDVLLGLGFFPIILAGPIQRPSSLLPQIAQKRVFNYQKAVDGLRQILWGLFVKIVIADNLAPEVDKIFLNFSDFSGSTLVLGALFYTLQIYADFSGYSNIAIGIAKLFGFDLMRNFAYPYFSRDITEFWKKWHMSLTSWFRDYLFLPISFAVSWRIKHEKIFLIKTDYFIYLVASIITWFLTGLWHGANYTFIVWGMINGFFLVLYHFQRKPRKRLFKKIGLDNNHFIFVMLESLFTLVIVIVAWIFFRADSIHHAFLYIEKMFSPGLLSLPEVFPKKTIFLGLLFMLVEWIQRGKEHTMQIDNISHRFIRWGLYIGVIYIIILLGGGNQKFIYFQF
jgi:alginate O-acetyltransferase complex protein AlgI